MNAVPKTNLTPANTAPAGSNPFAVRPVDGKAFSTYRVSAIKHNFHEHPLMQLPRLAELAARLARTSQCRFIIPGSEQHSKFDHTSASPDGRAIDEVFRRIEEPGSWVALYNVETDPDYAGFLKEVTDSARELIDREQPGMFEVGGFIFISAPPSVTPFHIDRENNLWLQVRGRKIMNVWDNTDRHVVPAPLVDHFIVSGNLDKVRLQDGFRERSHEFNVAAGDGVYFPSTSPHMTQTTTEWVKPGDGVSISIGVVFYTPHTYRMANIHALNEFLRRRFKIEPKYPGTSRWRDAIKFAMARAFIWALKTLRGYKPTKGMELPS
ncbi:MAG TPA: hypothetical protein VF033_13405 [Steroidobacteraceae bacterium]